MKTYCKKKWLNEKNSPSTGSIMTYYGLTFWGKKEPQMFIELADCHCKVRLHKTNDDTIKQYIKKIKLLEKTLHNYVKFLQKKT